MRGILMISLMLLFSSGLVFAQQPPSPEKMQQEMERMRQEDEQRQQELLERLKKDNPQAYQQRKDSLDRQAKINAIVSSFQTGKISDAQAENQLYPLIKQEVEDYINNSEARIKVLEKQLANLQKAKDNPDFLIKKRINEMLGKSMPNPEEY